MQFVSVWRLECCKSNKKPKMFKKAKILRLLFADVLSAFFFVHAYCANSAAATSDVELLRVLEERGVLTSQERLDIAKETAKIPVAVVEEGTLKISGGVQMQYAYLINDGRSGLDAEEFVYKNGFIPRRVIFTFRKEMQGDWGAHMSFDMILPHCMSNVYIFKNVDNNTLTGQARIGYIKPNMCVEEYTSAFKLFCIERSLATNYWTGTYGKADRKLGIGGFMTGAYWYGKSQSVKGFEYFVGISNSQNYELDILDLVNSGGDNSPDFWFSISQSFSFDWAKVKCGLNTAYGDNANKLNRNSAEGIWAANPYIQIDAADWKILAEFLSAGVEDGKRYASGEYAYALPIGLNFMAEYAFDIGVGKLAPVFRYSYLNTDGRGVSVGDALRRAPDVVSTRVFNEAQGFYFGLNWYISGHNIKVQVGYEFTQFSGVPAQRSGSADNVVDAETIRTELQILF